MRFGFFLRSAILGLILPAALFSVFTCRQQSLVHQMDTGPTDSTLSTGAKTAEICCFYPIWPVVEMPKVAAVPSRTSLVSSPPPVEPILSMQRETKVAPKHPAESRNQADVVKENRDNAPSLIVTEEKRQTKAVAKSDPSKNNDDSDLLRAREQIGSELRVLLSGYKTGRHDIAEEKKKPSLGLHASGSFRTSSSNGMSRWEMGLDVGFASSQGEDAMLNTAVLSQIRFGVVPVTPLRLVLALGAARLAPEREYIDPAINLLIADARIELAPRLIGRNYAFFSLGLGVVRADIAKSTDGLEARSINKPSVLLEAGLERKITGSLAIRVSYEYRLVEEIALAEEKTLSSLALVKVGVSFHLGVSNKGLSDPSGDKIFALTVEDNKP
ncbi:hypothetical protein JW992_01650 [candidate division KSB1 bacterium]|nr:hypothetical protein [candidate division KSB1 bacterium]